MHAHAAEIIDYLSKHYALLLVRIWAKDDVDAVPQPVLKVPQLQVRRQLE